MGNVRFFTLARLAQLCSFLALAGVTIMIRIKASLTQFGQSHSLTHCQLKCCSLRTGAAGAQ
jgi:hypothetical protein